MAAVQQLMAFEAGELDYEETVELFQQLVNDGTAWQLQGFYGRTAEALLHSGAITQPVEHDIDN